MTAPARTSSTGAKNRAATDSAQNSAQDTVESPARTTPAAERPRRTRSAAAERAYARRAQREGVKPAAKSSRVRPSASEAHPERAPRRQPVSRKQTSTATFVVCVICLLLVGVAATLWLSTQAIADSYRLDDAKKGVAALSEQAEQLRRDVTSMDSASALARRAQELGMVPSGDPAYLVVGPDGKVRMVGEPTEATAPKPPPSSATQTPPPSGTPVEGDQPQGQTQGQTNTPTTRNQQNTSPQGNG
jgi:hypothetical protein